MNLRENINQIYNTGTIKFLRTTHEDTNNLSGIIFKNTEKRLSKCN